MAEKRKVNISEIQRMLKEGKTRKDIGDYFGLNGTETKILFSHPKLKGLKTIKKKELPIEIYDDTEGEPLVNPKSIEDAQQEVESFPFETTSEEIDETTEKPGEPQQSQESNNVEIQNWG